MFRRRNPFFWMALLAGASFLGEPPPSAQAQLLELKIYDNGVQAGSTIIGSQTAVSFSGNTTDFHISLVGGASNNPGTSSSAFVDITSLTVYNLNSATNQLKLVLSEAGFTSPSTGTLMMSSSGSASTNVAPASPFAGTNNVTFLSTLNTSNVLFATSGNSTAAQSTGSIDGSTNGSFKFLPDPDTLTFSGASPFSLTNTTTITLTGASNGTPSVSTTGDTTVSPVTATPAPGGVVLAASALPMLIGGWFLRRRKQLQLA